MKIKHINIIKIFVLYHVTCILNFKKYKIYWKDCHGGPAIVTATWNLLPHGPTCQDLQQWRTWKTSQIRHDYPHSGEIKAEMRGFLEHILPQTIINLCWNLSTNSANCISHTCINVYLYCPSARYEMLAVYPIMNWSDSNVYVYCRYLVYWILMWIIEAIFLISYKWNVPLTSIDI